MKRKKYEEYEEYEEYEDEDDEVMKDIEKMKEEGRYEDIYKKYGSYEYKCAIEEAKYNKIKEEKGTVRALMWKIRRKLLRGLLKGGLFMGAASSIAFLPAPAMNNAILRVNETEYKKEIENYNKKIKEYAKEVNSIKIEGKKLDDVRYLYESYERYVG